MQGLYPPPVARDVFKGYSSATQVAMGLHFVFVIQNYILYIDIGKSNLSGRTRAYILQEVALKMALENPYVFSLLKWTV